MDSQNNRDDTPTIERRYHRQTMDDSRDPARQRCMSGSSMGTMRTIRPWGGHGSLTIFSFIFHITTGSSTTNPSHCFPKFIGAADAPVPRPPTRDRPGLSSSIPTNLTLSSETHSSQHTRAQRPRHHVISSTKFQATLRETATAHCSYIRHTKASPAHA